MPVWKQFAVTGTIADIGQRVNRFGRFFSGDPCKSTVGDSIPPDLMEDTGAVRPIWGIGLLSLAERMDKIWDHGYVQNLHRHLRPALRSQGASSFRSEKGFDVFCYSSNEEGGYHKIFCHIAGERSD